MITSFRGFAVTVCVLSFPFSFAFALEPGENLVLDPVSGDYTLTYSEKLKDGAIVLSHATFVPATKIVPYINSKFHLDHAEAVTYGYTVSSGAQSRQLLDTIRLDLVGKVTGSQDLPTDMQTSTQAQVYAALEANSHALLTPVGWRGAISSYVGGATVSWHPVDSRAGIQQKGFLKGFGFVSQNLPGLGVAKFKGARRFSNGFGGEGPRQDSDIRKQYEALKKNDFVARNAAVPSIAVPTPFDAAVLLDSIRAHVATWPGKQLLDPAFAAQLDRYMVAAADAYRLNNTKAGKEHIKKIRELLEHEHKYLDHDDEDHEDTDEHKTATRFTIDRLAARVLDFDLRYVLKRTEHEHEQGERTKGRD